MGWIADLIVLRVDVGAHGQECVEDVEMALQHDHVKGGRAILRWGGGGAGQPMRVHAGGKKGVAAGAMCGCRVENGWYVLRRCEGSRAAAGAGH